MATLIFLLGVRGAGKTSVLHALAGTPHVVVLQPSTTRPPREGYEDEYDHVQEWDHARYAWSIRFDEYTYGMRRSEIEKVYGDQIAITVFDPANVDILNHFRSNFAHEVITVGLDTIQRIEDQCARVGNQMSRHIDSTQLDRQRVTIRDCDIVFEGDLETVVNAVSALVDLVRGRGGLLTKKIIAAFLGAGSLLSDAQTSNVEPASYDLRVGDEAWCQGRAINLSDENAGFAIPPYSYAIVKAHEYARFPKFVAGRFDLKVSLFFDGVILSNGPQVDPGYHGPLFCMLFNGRDVQRGITRGLHFSTIEFRTTTGTTEGYSRQYQLRQRLAEFMSENSMQGPGGDILSRINLVDQRNAEFRSRWLVWNSITLAALVAIGLFAAGWAFYAADRAREAAFDAERAITTLNEKANRAPAGPGTELRERAGNAADGQAPPTLSAPPPAEVRDDDAQPSENADAPQRGTKAE